MGKIVSRFNTGKLATYYGIRAYAPYFGLALAFCWTYSIQRVVPNKLEGYFQIVVFTSTAIACLVFFALAKRTGNSLSSHRLLVFLLPPVATVSALLLIVPNPTQAYSEAVLLLAALCGLSIGWLYMLWGTFYSKLDIKPAIASLFGSVIVASVLKITISALAATTIGAATCATLPLLSACCWHYACRQPLPSESSQNRYTEKTLYALERTALGIVVFSLALGVIRSLDLDYFAQPFIFEGFAHLIEIIACIGILMMTYRRREDLEFSDLWLFVLLTIATGLIAAEYLPGALGAASFAILTAAQMFALVFLWLGLTDVSHNSPYPSDAVFGIGWCLYSLPVAIGSMIVYLPGVALGQNHLSLIVIYVLLITIVLFMKGHMPRELKLFIDLNPPLSNDNLTRLNEQIESLSKRYGLSDREKEVVVLYAQGRNRAFIASTLFISENTVRDHIKHVYRKIRIHNKQELIDAIQEVDS